MRMRMKRPLNCRIERGQNYRLATALLVAIDVVMVMTDRPGRLKIGCLADPARGQENRRRRDVIVYRPKAAEIDLEKSALAQHFANRPIPVGIVQDDKSVWRQVRNGRINAGIA